MTYPQQAPSARPETAAIVGGIFGGLAVAAGVIAYLTCTQARDESARDAVTELRELSAELKVSAAELKAAAATIEANARNSAPASPASPAITVFTPPPPPPPTMVLPPGFVPMTDMEPPAQIPGAAEAISCPTEHRCKISRGFLEELLTNPALLARQARIMPSVKDGEARGFKLYGIRPESLPKLLGYKNGDLLTDINDTPLKSMEGAMELYVKLRRADRLTIGVERKGERLVKELTIR